MSPEPPSLLIPRTLAVLPPNPRPDLSQRWPYPRPLALSSVCPPPSLPLSENRLGVSRTPEDPSKPPWQSPRPGLARLEQDLPTQAYAVFLQLVITALKCHKYDKNIQVTGSAALFYLTNSEYRAEQSVRLRRQVIQVVLNGMESYQEVTVSPCPRRPCMLRPSPSSPCAPCVPASPTWPLRGPCLFAPFSAWLCTARPPPPLLPPVLPTASLPDSGTWYSGPCSPAPPDQPIPHATLPTQGPCSPASGPLLMLTPQPFCPGTLCWSGGREIVFQ